MKKRGLSLFLALVLLLSVVPAVSAEGTSYEKEVDGVYYQVYPAENKAIIAGCEPDKLDDILVIPDSVDGCSVTELVSHALSYIHCSGLILPDTLTFIGEYAICSDEYGRRLFICMPDNEVTIQQKYTLNYYVSYCFLPEGFSLSEECREEASMILTSKYVGYEKHKEYLDPGLLVTVDGVPDERLMMAVSGMYRLDDNEYTIILLTDNCAIPAKIGGIPVTRVAASCAIDDPTVVLGDNVRVVEDGAFDVRFSPSAIYAPDCIEHLPADFFPKKYTCTLYATSGGYAEMYAQEHKLNFAPIDKTPFTDVQENAWYYPYVCDIYWAGLMKGTSDMTFEPNSTTTRAMVVQVLYNLAGDGRELGQYQIFNDIKYGEWYYNAVIWAYAAGICNGTSATTFSPNDPVTREQLAAFLYRFTTLCGIDCKANGDLSRFADRNQISNYAKDAISWAVGAGIINGKSPTSVAPRAYATRAEIAAMLCRLLDYIDANLPA